MPMYISEQFKVFLLSDYSPDWATIKYFPRMQQQARKISDRISLKRFIYKSRLMDFTSNLFNRGVYFQ